MVKLLSEDFHCLSNNESELLENFNKLSDEMKQEFLVLCKVIAEEQNGKEEPEKDK